MNSRLMQASGEVLAVEVRRHGLTMRRPFRSGSAEIGEREVVLLCVRWGFEDGQALGVGEVAPLPGWSAESLEECLEVLQESSTGELVERAQGLNALRCGLQMSRLHALTRHQGCHLADLFAGSEGCAKARVTCQSTIGSAAMEQTLERAAEAISRGFGALKLKVGARPLDEDLRRLRALREEFPRVTLRVDANRSLGRREAKRFLRAVAKLDVDLIEEPIGAESLEELCDFAQETGAPLGADETLAGETDISADRLRGLRAVVLKPTSLGGFDRAFQWARAAKTADVEPISSTLLESSIGRQFIAEFAAGTDAVDGPQGLATGRLFLSDIFEEPLRGGSFDIARGRAELNRLAVEGW